MLNRVKEYVKKWDMLNEQDNVIVGVSGGADSVCLLFILMELKKEIPFQIMAVHVNHELRGEDAKRDELFVKELCKQQDIPCVIYSENVELIAKNRKQSTEEAGRYVRREKFMLALKEFEGTKIALAHHMNDNVETFLMNAARGTGLKGLGGMQPVTGNLIRPLLCLKRIEIEKYLNEHHISYCTDVTNSEDDYTRNRIRNHMVPFLEEQVNAKAVQHIDELMGQLSVIQEYLQSQVLQWKGLCVKEEENGIFVKEDRFAEVPEALQAMLLKEVLANVCGQEKDLEMIHILQLKELFDKQVGKKVDLPYKVEGKRCYGGIRIRKKEEVFLEKCIEEIRLNPGESTAVSWDNKNITCDLYEISEIKEMPVQNSRKKCFDYDIISSGVCIRTRQPGDYITIHPDGRTQKLKAFFVNEKIPQEERDQVLLVADGKHIMWIEGYRTNCMYQVNKHTKRVLEIQIDKGEESWQKQLE